MLLWRPRRHRTIVTPVSGRFEIDMRAGYPEDVRGVILGSPMREGDVLASVRVRLQLSTVNRHGLVAGAIGTGKTKTADRRRTRARSPTSS